ncbi:FAD-dependent monooxygenase [Streptomyces sp. NBC_01089]|uniref:FAD-dependent monooxygenase n=1 Tax=Streptomyces sp. NBC_01089 TaxID=2903747 RepID=UPI00386A53A7|nr:FAD-dependent monooxygenase [Streptomyces sp. NBC_01089]
MPSALPVLTHTSVVVIGAGPAGLVVANRLHDSGVDCVLLEAESREFIERRPRAGFMEEWAVRALAGHGLAERILVQAETQGEFEFRFEGERHTVPTAELSGRSHFVYPQPRLVTDLLAAYVDKGAGDARFGVRDVQLDGIGGTEGIEGIEGTDGTHGTGDTDGTHGTGDTDGTHGTGGDRPVVSYTDPLTGARHRVVCDYVAGCDGARGVTRQAIPDGRVTVSRRDDGVAWLALLAQAPPSADGVVFGIHERGFGAHMARSPEVTRYYLQVPPGDAPENWPHERVWHELRTRLAADGARPLTEGPLVEKVVLDMHNYVVEPMSYGRLHLAGDSAHLVAPIAAKGMNLAIHDALLLADALIAAAPGRNGADGDGGDGGTGLAGYSEAALERVWQYQEFSQWLSDVLHGASSGDRFRAATARARLRRILASGIPARAFAGLYMGEESGR